MSNFPASKPQYPPSEPLEQTPSLFDDAPFDMDFDENYADGDISGIGGYFADSNPNLTAVPTAKTYSSVDPSRVDEEQPLTPYSPDDFDDYDEPTENALTPLSSPIKFNTNYQISMRQSKGFSLNTEYPALPLPIQQRRQSPGANYSNQILSSFKNPSVPLSVLDRLLFPFSQDVLMALQQELANRRYISGDHDNHFWPRGSQVESPPSARNDFQSFAPPSTPAPARNNLQSYLPPSIPAQRLIAPPRATSPAPSEAPSVAESIVLVNGKKSGNKRPLNITSLDTSIYYTPLPKIPTSWGARNKYTYNPYGELNPNKKFSTQDILEYISYHPLASLDGTSGLTLWLQVAPADSGKRYGNIKSDKCRFENCPDSRHTIRKGDFRVAFDEGHCKERTTDPFHNAGYVHLYCMEKFLDFPSICQRINVQPDVRKIREGKNKMALNRDHASMQDIALNFIQTAKPWAEFDGSGMRPDDYYEHTLCYQLTMEHLKKQPKHLQKIRETRGGNTIDIHRNNLDKYVLGHVELERQRKAGTRPGYGVRGPRPRKRKAVSSEEEEDVMASLIAEDDDVLDDNILEEQASLGRNKKQRRQ